MLPIPRGASARSNLLVAPGVYHMQKTCLNSSCNKAFNALPREINRGNGKFCSRICASKHNSQKRKSVPNLKCSNPICNNMLYRNESKIKACKSNLFFCCRKCKDISQRIGGLVSIQPSHYGIINTNYRDVAFRNYPHQCNECLYDKHIEILQVHHKDGNRNNNTLQNLQILCPNCHAIIHRVH